MPKTLFQKSLDRLSSVRRLVNGISGQFLAEHQIRK